jgi:hypothetical protein
MKLVVATCAEDLTRVSGMAEDEDEVGFGH